MTTFDFERLLIEACRKHGVFFAWVGIFVVERSGLEKVLKELPPQVRVLGLDAYRFDGHSVALATDYWPLDLGNGNRRGVGDGLRVAAGRRALDRACSEQRSRAMVVNS